MLKDLKQVTHASPHKSEEIIEANRNHVRVKKELHHKLQRLNVRRGIELKLSFHNRMIRIILLSNRFRTPSNTRGKHSKKKKIRNKKNKCYLAAGKQAH